MVDKNEDLAGRAEPEALLCFLSVYLFIFIHQLNDGKRHLIETFHQDPQFVFRNLSGRE